MLSHRHQDIRCWIFALGLLVSVTVIVGGVTQAATPALTPITNRAMAVYPWQNKIYTTWSNWVTVVVQQVAGLVIYPCSVGTPASDEFVPACAQCVAPGQQVIIPLLFDQHRQRCRHIPTHREVLAKGRGTGSCYLP